MSATGPRLHRRLGRAMIYVDVFLVVAVLAVGTVYGYARYRLGQIHRVSLGSAPASGPRTSAPLVDEAPGQPFNLALVGSDSRSFASNTADRRKFGDTSVVDGQRSDTLMVIHIDPGARTARVLSIHRDLYVPIWGSHGSAKINSALDKGPAALLNTLRDDLGISVSHFVQLDFASFRKVVDTIGPVPFYFPTPVRDAFTGLAVVQPGCARLTGTDALALVRSRHLEYQQDGRWREDPTDDRGRIVRQQDFLRRVVTMAVTRGLGNPATLNQLIGSIAPSLTVDSGFETAEMGRLARRFATAGPAAISWFVLPVLDAKIDGQDVERLDQPAADSVLAAFGGRARGPLLARSSSSTTRPTDRSPSAALPSLPAGLVVRIIGSTSAPGAADLARQDLTSAGVPATVTLTGGPPASQVRVNAPWPLRTAAADLAALVPGAAAGIDTALSGNSMVMVVGGSWPGLTASRTARATSTTTTAPAPSATASSTTSTVPAKGTDDKVSCP